MVFYSCWASLSCKVFNCVFFSFNLPMSFLGFFSTDTDKLRSSHDLKPQSFLSCVMQWLYLKSNAMTCQDFIRVTSSDCLLQSGLHLSFLRNGFWLWNLFISVSIQVIALRYHCISDHCFLQLPTFSKPVPTCRKGNKTNCMVVCWWQLSTNTTRSYK